MTDDTFLSAIHAEPHDDMHRLAYADWLEERGDPRGEFIQVQCRLARLSEDDPAYSEDQERERELLDRHRLEWLGELRSVAKRSTFRRGFLDEVALEPRAFLGHRLPDCPPTVRRVLVDLEGYEVDPSVVEFLPESVARENLCFLFAVRNTELFLAMERPDDHELIQKLNFILNRDIFPVPATPAQIVDAIVRHYGNTETESVDSILYENPEAHPTYPRDDEAPVAMLVNLILREAVRLGATRIRLESDEHGVEVYCRILGQEVQRDRIPRRLFPAVVGQIRQRCGLPAADETVQRGNFDLRWHQLLSRFDVCITPTDHGPRVVLDVDTNYDPVTLPD